MSDIFVDQTRFFDPSRYHFDTHVIGCGGIGAPLIQILAKMGVPVLHLWDTDILEARNGPAEVAYSEAMVGRPKVEAAMETVRFLVGDRCKVIPHYEYVTADTELSGVVISGVDRMTSRQEIWKSIQKNFWEIPFYMDGRIAGEYIRLYSLNPADFDNKVAYESSLYGDDVVMKLDCGARTIGYVGFAIASEMGRTLTRFQRELPIEFRFDRDLAKDGVNMAVIR